MNQLNELQKDMAKHYENLNIPWYMDEHNLENKDKIIVVFGADDGEGEKIFQFLRTDNGDNR